MGFLRIAFGWSGRIDRATFLSALGLLSLLGGIHFLLSGLITLISPAFGVPFSLLLLPLSGWSGLALNVKRLRDMGRSPGLAFLPIGLVALAIFTMLPSLAAAVSGANGAGVIAVFLGGGLALIVSAVVSLGMMFWLVCAGSSPNGSGKRLTLFGGGGGDAPEESGRSAGLEAALNMALAQRAAAPAHASAAPARASATPAPAFALATAGRPSGLPQRSGGAAGGFGRRR